MTEAEWLSTPDAPALFHHLRSWVKPPGRKHRLFACAVCRECWHLLTDLGRHAVAVAEATLDGNATRDNWSAVSHDLAMEQYRLHGRLDRLTSPSAEVQASLIASAAVAFDWPGEYAAGEAIRNLPHEGVPVADLLRDIFGNPCRLVTFLPEWRTSTVLALAEQMYEARDFSAMPILADALQDAGCTDDAILTHCRGLGPHVRGCFCVDAILGKT